jgi:structural maintenance of chromosome 4
VRLGLIAHVNPKAPSENEDGLLEYLEDIIGTSQDKVPIDEVLVEMELAKRWRIVRKI